MEGRGAQLLGYRVLGFEDRDGNALAAEQQRRRQPDRTGARDQHMRFVAMVHSAYWLMTRAGRHLL